jgi:streptogramin lyase
MAAADGGDEKAVLPVSPLAVSPLAVSPAPPPSGASSVPALPLGGRARPLISGSVGESRLIRDVDDKIAHVERFHARRKGTARYTPLSESGYDNMDQAVADMIEIFDMVWKSSTREFGRSPVAVADYA